MTAQPWRPGSSDHAGAFEATSPEKARPASPPPLLPLDSIIPISRAAPPETRQLHIIPWIAFPIVLMVDAFVTHGWALVAFLQIYLLLITHRELRFARGSLAEYERRCAQKTRQAWARYLQADKVSLAEAAFWIFLFFVAPYFALAALAGIALMVLFWRFDLLQKLPFQPPAPSTSEPAEAPKAKGVWRGRTRRPSLQLQPTGPASEASTSSSDSEFDLFHITVTVGPPVAVFWAAIAIGLAVPSPAAAALAVLMAAAAFFSLHHLRRAEPLPDFLEETALPAAFWVLGCAFAAPLAFWLPSLVGTVVLLLVLAAAIPGISAFIWATRDPLPGRSPEGAALFSIVLLCLLLIVVMTFMGGPVGAVLSFLSCAGLWRLARA